MKTIILGGGLAGLSTAYFIQKKSDDSIVILEKEEHIGGLCRTIEKDGYLYDIGPHNLYSKDKEMLNLMNDLVGEYNYLKRRNKIIYKGRVVQYPFENDLSKLPEKDMQYCVTSFDSNPYTKYDATNMLQFFLKMFGEGITNCYLRPYNQKIWKYDPSFMNTSMVERIPQPTSYEIHESAKGSTVEGEEYQQFFTFPASGGIEAVPKAFLEELNEKCVVYTNSAVVSLEEKNGQYIVYDVNGRSYEADRVISTIPLQELAKVYQSINNDVKDAIDDLHYNSIIIAFVKIPYDLLGDNFAFYIPEEDIIFHRVSKMDYLGDNYHHNEGECTLMVEITYRDGDHISNKTDQELSSDIRNGMKKIGFIRELSDLEMVDITRYQYAYVIYDLKHEQNMKTIREYFNNTDIVLNGRFGNFEYWNMDRVLRESFELVEKLYRAD